MLAKFIDNAREDSLTAAVFSHLLHLPSEDFWRILKRSCYSENVPDYPGEPRCIHAWPSWNPLGTKNTLRVVPDLVLEFAPFDLIIESKRWDDGMQDEKQWEKQLIAYTNEYGAKKRQVKMIALGGIHTPEDKVVKHVWSSPATKGGTIHEFVCPVHMCRWSTLLLECQRLKTTLEERNKKSPNSRTAADIRILNDLSLFFEAHDYRMLKWFADFDFKSNLLGYTVDSDQQYFQNIRQKFQNI